MSSRDIAALSNVADPAWPAIEALIEEAAWGAELLPVDPAQAGQALLLLQVDAGTALGAVCLHTGGLLVDGGWLRLLGSGHPRLPGGVPEWSGLVKPPRFAGFAGALVVGHDVLGGLFAVNGGGLPGPEGHAFYLSPEHLQWEDMGFGYMGLLEWALTGDLPGFYNASRWGDWEEDVAGVSGDQGIYREPPPWSVAGQRGELDRQRVLPMAELMRKLVSRHRPILPPPGGPAEA